MRRRCPACRATFGWTRLASWSAPGWKCRACGVSLRRLDRTGPPLVCFIAATAGMALMPLALGADDRRPALLVAAVVLAGAGLGIMWSLGVWGRCEIVSPSPAACDQCGYDLRGTPTTDGLLVCPECGFRHQVEPAATTRKE